MPSSKTLEPAAKLAPWMPLERYWPDHPDYGSTTKGPRKVESPESSSQPIPSTSDAPMKELSKNFTKLFVNLRAKKPVLSVREPEVICDEVASKKAEEVNDSVETMVVQTIKYLVEAQKKCQLPHQIAAEEFNAKAKETVKFLEQLAAQAKRQVKKASTEILAFSQDAQCSSHDRKVEQIISGFNEYSYRLAQGALPFVGADSFFAKDNQLDKQLANQCASQLIGNVKKGASSEASPMAKKKVFSF